MLGYHQESYHFPYLQINRRTYHSPNQQDYHQESYHFLTKDYLDQASNHLHLVKLEEEEQLEAKQLEAEQLEAELLEAELQEVELLVLLLLDSRAMEPQAAELVQ